MKKILSLLNLATLVCAVTLSSQITAEDCSKKTGYEINDCCFAITDGDSCTRQRVCTWQSYSETCIAAQ